MSSTADTALRDRLKAIREDLREKRSERADAKKERDAAKEALANAELAAEGRLTEMKEFKDAEQAVAAVGALDDQINDLSKAELGILEMLGDDAVEAATSLKDGEDASKSFGWDGYALLAQKEGAYQEARERGLFRSSNRFGTIHIGEITSREEFARFISPNFAAVPAAPAGIVDTAGVQNVIRPDWRGVLAPNLRPLRLLDLIPTGTTDSNTIEYVQVVGIPASAAEVAEGSIKPEQGLQLQDATATVRTIAGWIKVNRQAMDDAPGLATMINTLLPYDVRRRIENQILVGDGTGQNLTGLLNTTGLGHAAFVAGNNIADMILRAMTVVILSDAEPNFAAINPLSWQDLMLMRTNEQGANTGQYLYGGPTQVLPTPTIWGLTITPSVVIPQTSPLVGDTNGMTLLVREAVNVKTSDSDQDDFVRNRVTVLAEARVTNPVWRPSSFATAALS